CPLLSSQGQAFAQGDPFDRRAPSCTAGTVSGTSGYRLTGSLAGIGPISVIGVLTQNSDGTLTGLHKLVNFNGLPITDLPYSGTFKINSDCSATGEFIDGMGVKVTFKFVALNGGDELYIMNTDAGNLLSGEVKRIAKAGRAPSCSVGTISGQYGVKLEGSVQGIGPLVEVGVLQHGLDDVLDGIV